MDKKVIINQIWPDWKIKKILESSSYEKIYKASKEQYNITHQSAIKVIQIPESNTEFEMIKDNHDMSNDYNAKSATTTTKRAKSKTILAIVIALALATSTTACYQKTNNKATRSENTVTEIKKIQEKPENTPKAKTKEQIQDSSITKIKEQVIYNENDLIITINDCELDLRKDYIEIPINFTNNSSKNYAIESDTIIINGLYFNEALIAPKDHDDKYTNAGKTIKYSLSINKTMLKTIGIKKIGDITTNINIYSLNKIADEEFSYDYNIDNINIKTSLSSQVEHRYDTSGIIIFDDKEIKIIAKPFSNMIYWGAPIVAFYIENNSDKDIDFLSKEHSVVLDNTSFKDLSFYCQTKAHSKNFASMYFYTFTEDDIENLDMLKDDIKNLDKLKNIKLTLETLDKNQEPIPELGDINIDIEL